jgi:hypothetical protein
VLKMCSGPRGEVNSELWVVFPVHDQRRLSEQLIARHVRHYLREEPSAHAERCRELFRCCPTTPCTRHAAVGAPVTPTESIAQTRPRSETGAIAQPLERKIRVENLQGSVTVTALGECALQFLRG